MTLFRLFFAYASGTDFDLVFDIWDILTLDQNITLGAFEEISIISDMTAFSFVFFRNAGINKSPFDIISMVDWSAFMNLTKEDFANTLELTKRIVKVLYFYNQELEPDKYLLTEEQFDEAFDMDLIGTIIAHWAILPDNSEQCLMIYTMKDYSNNIHLKTSF